MSEAMITRRGGGGGAANLQAKTAIPAASASTVTPDSGYDGLSSVTVAAITPQKAAEIYIPSTQDQVIAADRWLAGAQTISGDANLVAANIKKGISIFGVAGSYEAAGLDTNSAVLKVVTSTGCSVTITNGTDSFTQQDADGFVRSNDAAVTEHFFVIPSAAFGTFTVTSTHPTYGDNEKQNAVVIGNAGRMYEVLCGGKNIILDGTFGLQEGYSWASSSGYSRYDETYRRIEYISGNAPVGRIEQAIPIAAFDTLTVEATAFSAGLMSTLTAQGVTICNVTGNGEQSAQITDKHYTTAFFGSSYFRYITKIILT